MRHQTGAKVAEEIQKADVIHASSTGLAFRLLNKEMKTHIALPPNTFTGDHIVIMVPHLFSTAASANISLSGMEQRMLQIIGALDSSDCILHIICSGCNVTSNTNTALIPTPVHIYRTGSPLEQIDAMLAADPCIRDKIPMTLDFVTQVTMALSQSTFKTLKKHGAVPKWSKTTPLASELVSCYLREKLSSAGLPGHARLVITDDVHYVRIESVLAESLPDGGGDPTLSTRATAYLKARESEMYSTADLIITVTDEDGKKIENLIKKKLGPETPANIRPLVRTLFFIGRDLPLASSSVNANAQFGQRNYDVSMTIMSPM